MKRLLLLATVSASCIATSPEGEAEDALGSDEHAEDFLGDEGRVRGPGNRHRPGQPCIVCHDGDFALAGTVFFRETCDGPLHRADDVRVCVWHDDPADETCASTSSGLGNFHAFRQLPPLPLHVRLRSAADGHVTATMRTTIGRDRSCAGCHALGDADEASPGPVLREAPPCD